MQTEFYEDNGGGIHAIVFDGNRNAVRLYDGFESICWNLRDLYQEAIYGFQNGDEYDPADYDGMQINEVVDEIIRMDALVAEFSEDRICFYPPNMGYAARKLFGIEVW